MFKKILIGVSPTAECSQAIATAISLAEASGSSLVLFSSCNEMDAKVRSEEIEAKREALKNRLVHSCSEKVGGIADWTVQVAQGFFDVELIKAARKLEADLVVIGPEVHYEVTDCIGRYREVRNPLDRVSREVRCPVMIISREFAREKLDFGKIIVATDFSRQADCAVDYAIQLAVTSQSQLILLHVLKEDQTTVRKDSYEQLSKRLEQAKQRLIASYGDRLVNVPLYSLVVREGIPEVEILKYLREAGADLAVMAHHSQTKDPQEASLGSTTLHVALNATCPTMSCNRDFVLKCNV